MQVYDTLLEYLSASLGSLAGDIAGKLLFVLFCLLFWLLVWGFWCDRLLSKAGFMGKTFWVLFILLNQTWLIAPLAITFLNYEAQEIVGGISVVALWLGFVLTAVLPWPIRQKPKPPKLKS